MSGEPRVGSRIAALPGTSSEDPELRPNNIIPIAHLEAGQPCARGARTIPGSTPPPFRCQRMMPVVIPVASPTQHPRAHRYEHPPETYRSSPGEKFLMQFGESMRIEELPAGTRVVYPGVRKNAPSSPKEMRAMVERALDDPVGQPPLRDKIRDLVKAKGSNGCK